MASRLGLEHLASLGTNVDIPGVRWDEYSFPLEGDEDARLEAEAIFKRARKAEWVVITDSAARHWVFKRGETAPAISPTSLALVSSPPREQLVVSPRLALPPPAPVDTTCTVVSTGPAVTGTGGFRARLEARKLRRFLTLLGGLGKRGEHRLEVGSAGWVVKSIDPSHVAMLRVALEPGEFEEFISPESTAVFVDGDKWAEVAKLLKPKETVDVAYDSAKAEVTFRFRFITRTIRSSATALDGVAPSGYDGVVRKMNHTAEYTVDGDALAETVKSVEMLSDHVVLEADGHDLTAQAAGDTDDSRSTLSQAGQGSGKSMYPLNELGPFVKSLKGAEQVKVAFGVEYPLKVDVAVDGVEATYLLAPKVEED